ncbi:MAG: hypothetical protein M3135_00600 [Actinomycetota bacterium]|nr:hypothetical protein [Actinomycetota bacterium]
MVRTVTMPAEEVVPGGSIDVGETVRNRGIGSAHRSLARHYLSLDRRRDRSDIALGAGRRLSRLGGGRTSTGWSDLAVPRSVPEGSYFVISCADDPGRVREAIERNNCRSSATRVAVKDPRRGTISLVLTRAPEQIATAGEPILSSNDLPVRVRVQDGLGNPVRGTQVTVSLITLEGPGPLLGTTSVTSDQVGHADFGNLEIEHAGSYQLKFAVKSKASLLTPTFSVQPAAPASASLLNEPISTQIGMHVQGETGPLAVRVRDGFGNSVNGAQVMASAVDADGGAGPLVEQAGGPPWATTGDTSFGSGVALFEDAEPSSLQLATTGTYEMVFTAGGANVRSSAFVVSSPPVLPGSTEPSPSPEPTSDPSPSPDPDPSPSPDPDPSPSPDPDPSPSPDPDPSPSPEPTPDPSPSAEPTPDPSPSGEPTPDPSPSVPLPSSVDAPWFPTTGAYLGATVSRQRDRTSPVCRDLDPTTGRAAFESADCVGQWSYIDRVYNRWDGNITGELWPTAYELGSRDQGRRLFINWTARRATGTVVPWAEIAAGQHDEEIDAVAGRIKAFGSPVYLSFQAEPENGTGTFGTTTDFQAAWRHLVTRFEELGVTNVRWVLVLTAWTFDPSSGRDPLAYWPGADVVDAIGVDGYNWYGCSGAGQPWVSFGSIFQGAYDWIVAQQKPMVLGEWGSVEQPSDPWAKAQWIADAADWIKQHPNVKVAAYFHSHDVNTSTGRDCDWTLDSSVPSMSAFRTMVADPYFNPPLLPVGP